MTIKLNQEKILLLFIFIIILTAALSAAWRSLNTMRHSNRQTLCVHNLKTLSIGLNRYAEDHQNQFPKRLADLWPKYISNPEDLICPELQAEYRNTHGVPHPFPAAPSPDVIESLSSYVYIPGHTTADPAHTILLYEKDGHHAGKGRSLLYLNGRGAWEPPEHWHNAPNKTLPAAL